MYFIYKLKNVTLITKFHLIHKLGNILQILNKHTPSEIVIYDTCTTFKINLHFLFFEIVYTMFQQDPPQE